MSEKRSLLEYIFGKPPQQEKSYTQMNVLSGYTAKFTPWGNQPYEAAAVREAVDAIARNVAKLKPMHIRRINDELHNVKDQLNRKLQHRPNPNMSAYDFLYRIVTTLQVENNAFAYTQWEGFELKAIWPINPGSVDFIQDKTGKVFCKFHFTAGNIILPYEEVVHLRRHYYNNDLYGSTNGPINSTLSASHTVNQGIENAIKTSANLRGIIKVGNVLKESDLKAYKDRFVNEYMTINNQGGVAALDSKAEYQELKHDPKLADAPEMKELRDAVYRYWGVNEKIVSSNYNEDEWNAFYESTIEPIAIQMSLEFSQKLFTERERGHGNEIIFEANRLQYASARTKIALAREMMPMGVLSVNEVREIFNMPPVDGGDERIKSLNYVNADKADQYQLGNNDDILDDLKEGDDL